MNARSTFFKFLRVTTLGYRNYSTKPNTLYVLMFHQVNDDSSFFYPAVPTAVFDRLCGYVKRNFEIIRFSEASEHFNNSDSPAVIISFDDGHYDIIKNALPILKKHGITKFNVNIDTEILESGLPQDNVRIYDVLNRTKKSIFEDSSFFEKPVTIDKVNAYKTEAIFSKKMQCLTVFERRRLSDSVRKQLSADDLEFSKVVSSKDVRTLSELGVEIGSHTHAHAMLPILDPQAVARELSNSKTILEGICDKEVEIIAYPNGLSNERIDEIAIDLGYKTLLYTGDVPNSLLEIEQSRFWRINQYHSTVEDSIASIYGIHAKLKNLKSSVA